MSNEILKPQPDPESGLPGGGRGRREEVGGSGVYPASGGRAPVDSLVRTQGEWGLGAPEAEEPAPPPFRPALDPEGHFADDEC